MNMADHKTGKLVPASSSLAACSRAALAAILLVWLLSGCRSREPAASANLASDDQVTRLGTVEVAARLIEIPGKLIDDPLYDHAFIFKYEVLTVYRGQLGEERIAVAHYNPVQPRAEARDEFNPQLGGTLRRFRAGDVHRMALEVPLDDYYIGPIVDRYHAEEKGPIYWAVWTNQASG